MVKWINVVQRRNSPFQGAFFKASLIRKRWDRFYEFYEETATFFLGWVDMIFLNFLNVYPPGNYQMIFLFP